MPVRHSETDNKVKIKPRILALSVSAAVWFAPVSASNLQEQTHQPQAVLSQLISMALNNDSNRKQYFAQSQALRETGVASATLMDPKIKVGFGGLPVDSFKFDEDPMTNISVGLMQQFERGSTLELQQKKSNQQADGVGLQIDARELDVINSMTQLWLELGYQQQAKTIMLENRRLLKEMESFIQTNYSIGKSEAQDLLNAQLQVSKLDEKLQANQQMQQRLMAQLSEWLGANWSEQIQNVSASNQLNWTKLDQQLNENLASSGYYQQLSLHPMVQMASQTISTSETQVEIAQQAYQPQFGVEVMYAYRQANGMMGEPASDLVSAYLTMDIPLFTGNRQDRNLAAAQYQVGAAKSQKDTLLAQMNAKVNALLVDRTNLAQRLERYQSTLLPQANARIRAVERGYQNNTSQFNDVITASADELALQLEQQRLIADLNIVNSNLAALLDGFDYQVEPVTLAQGEQE
ncbi:TolC family protein [Vibrio coralliilyticus]|uniref:TolC family protein n=1 Tax=Vibrio coralliilyticus TaxID=190893 RepID=UPI00155FA990|nr:TolC family protein [Vibrio coralliilyticus]NRF54288.1 TolC family protein [Vibrio coralliilyticus]NRG02113.1 TolC family protein [Vibrio coralliilyticus]